MESYKFSCPHCNNQMLASPDWYGKQAYCPHCAKRIEVPYPTALRSRFVVVPEQGELRTVLMHRPRPNKQPKAPATSKESGAATDPAKEQQQPPAKPWWKLW
jgi:hypothetical protein